MILSEYFFMCSLCTLRTIRLLKLNLFVSFFKIIIQLKIVLNSFALCFLW